MSNELKEKMSNELKEPAVKLIESTERKLTIKIDQAHYEALAKLAELDDRSIAQTARRIMKGAITSAVKGFADPRTR
jgi:hypothetical protein